MNYITLNVVILKKLSRLDPLEKSAKSGFWSFTAVLKGLRGINKDCLTLNNLVSNLKEIAKEFTFVCDF